MGNEVWETEEKRYFCFSVNGQYLKQNDILKCWFGLFIIFCKKIKNEWVNNTASLLNQADKLKHWLKINLRKIG